MLMEIMPKLNISFFFFYLCVFDSEMSSRENHLLCRKFLCLNHIHSVPSYPRRPLVTYQRCTVRVHMRNFSCCDGAVGHFNCDTGFILRSAALWKRYSVESYTHKEVCTEVLWREQYIAFQKRGFLVSVHVIIEKLKKKRTKRKPFNSPCPNVIN